MHPYLFKEESNLQYTFKLNSIPATEESWHLESCKLKVNYCRRGSLLRASIWNINCHVSQTDTLSIIRLV
jgi:hypothetical protein